MLGIVAQDSFWNRRFQVINFDVQQMFNEGLRNVFVTEYESEHNRVSNVKVVKRLYVHLQTPFKFRSANLQRKIAHFRKKVNFANNCLQENAFFYKEVVFEV